MRDVEIDIDDISKINIFNDRDTNTAKEVFVFRKNEAPLKMKFNDEINDLVLAFLKENGYEEDKDGVNKARENGLLDINFTDGEDYKSTFDEYEASKEKFKTEPKNIDVKPIDLLDEETTEEKTDVEDSTEEEKSEEEGIITSEDLKNGAASKRKKAARITAGVLAGATVVGGMAVLLKSCDNEKSNTSEKDYSSMSFDELLKEMPEGHERRTAFEKVRDTLVLLNNNALTFKVQADGENVLRFNAEEVLAANLVLNNYTTDELLEIFGSKEINAQEILENYESFASKLSIYYMNATTPSGISTLISDQGNKAWFEELESSIVNFNKNVNQDNADKVIRTFGYLYTHEINGSTTFDINEASIGGVKNLGLNILRGYQDANANDKYNKYLTVASAPSEFDSKYVSLKSAQIQKGEKLSFYLDLAEKGNCTIDWISQHLETMANNLTNMQNAIYAQAYLEAGDTKKAEDSLSGVKDGKIVEDIPTYDTMFSALVRNMEDKNIGPLESDITVLYNNRVRGYVPITSKTSAGEITMDEWNKMSSKERFEFAKENGKVTGKTTKTTEKEVSYDSLSASEKEKVDKEKEKLEYKVEINNKEYEGEKAKAAKAGWTDATNYAEQKNAYSYHDIYNKVNPSYPTKVPTNGTLSDIAANAYAFEGVTITSKDSQIQARFNSDVAKYSKTTSDSKLINSYKEGWLQGIDQKLTSAVNQGKITKKEAQDLYNQAVKSAEEKNKNSKAEEKPTTPTKNESEKPTNTPSIPVVEEKKDEHAVSDPNLAGPVDSDEGFKDFVDENFDGFKTSSVSTQSIVSNDNGNDYYQYIAQLALEAFDEAFSNEESNVLIKK